MLINRPPPPGSKPPQAQPLLPLSKTLTKKIAVLGPNGGCTPNEIQQGNGGMKGEACVAGMNMLGSYTQYAYNGQGKYPVSVPTIADALKQEFPGASVEFEAGADIDDTGSASHAQIVALTEGADVAVVVVGDDLRTSSEWGDRDSLDLPGGQMALLESVVATGVPVVLVTITGRTPSFGGPANAILANVTSMFSAFRPGQVSVSRHPSL